MTGCRCPRFPTTLAPVLLLAASMALASALPAAVPLVENVELQPLKAQVLRVIDALGFLGEPLSGREQRALERAFGRRDKLQAVTEIQKVLDSRVLLSVHINAESRVKVARGNAHAELNEQGWRVFLVKVQNDAGVTAELAGSSPNAAPLYIRSTGSPDPKPSVTEQDVPDRWLDLQMFNNQPLEKALSGLEVEYRIIQLYSRDRGKREAKFAFNVGQGTQDIGFRNESSILFRCHRAVKVHLDIMDDDGTPTTGQFVFRDDKGRIYPALSRRLAPDFFFHNQIYRHSGEIVLLPPGEYDVMYTRGPEYRIKHRQITIPERDNYRLSFRLVRWIKLTDYNWYSGDHHVHAAGCAHYEAPTAGVTPDAMMRHILGEDLNVGCVLTWGPCWYAQKEFFDGSVHPLSTPQHLMRYDVEVSGFPSSHAGHLCLLRLTEDDYPDTDRIEQWPSWDLPVLKWGKEQGGVVGFSHSGWGLQVEGEYLPNYNMPKFNGIGANEYIVDDIHGVCDFISAVDTPSIWELNIWYHTLNCGSTCRISGETDFPCIYGERVGLGRGYVKIDEGKPLTYDNWVQGIKDGRSYCCDGLSHLIDFQVNGLGVGEPGAGGRSSVLAVKPGEALAVSVNAVGLLAETPRDDIRSRPLHQKPYWHIERARIGETRTIPVELIVNGQSVETISIEADGNINELTFEYTPAISSWVALRIFPSCHTNPVFVEVDGAPIRASKRSAQWCLEAVDVCWESKVERIREEEREEAAAAYEVARQAYQAILEESYDDTE
jgi:hypothetical protein